MDQTQRLCAARLRIRLDLVEAFSHAPRGQLHHGQTEKMIVERDAVAVDGDTRCAQILIQRAMRSPLALSASRSWLPDGTVTFVVSAMRCSICATSACAR